MNQHAILLDYLRRHGRTYWLRVSVGMARPEVFDQPTTLQPLAMALAGSLETFGHRPGH